MTSANDDLIRRADALVAVALGDTVTALQRKISAITPAPDGLEAGMRRAAEMFHREQVLVWVQDIVEGLGFADVLKIESYDDNIAAHEVIEVGLIRIREAILAAIPAAGAWEPPADQRPGEYTLAPHLQKLIENVIRQDGRMSKALRQQLAAYVSPPPAPAGEGEP